MTQEIQADNFPEAVLNCYDGARKPLAAIFGSDESLHGGALALYALFYNFEKHSLDTIKTSFPTASAAAWPSLAALVPAAAAYEREVHEMFGFMPQGHPDLRPLALYGNYPHDYHPLLKKSPASGDCQCKDAPERLAAAGDALNTVPDRHSAEEKEEDLLYGEKIFTLSPGPLDDGGAGPACFRFTQQGERILRLELECFCNHRGVEKAAEGRTPPEALLLAERVCGSCAAANALSYCQALEKLSSATLPRRAALIRVLALELERLCNHVAATGNICLGAGFVPVAGMAARLQDYLHQLNELLSGNRFLRGLIIPGGVSCDANEQIIEEIGDVLEEVEKEYGVIQHILTQRSSFLERVRGRGVITAKTAADLCLEGIVARASGSLRDSRRDIACAVYDELEFTVITEQAGDAEARLRVRMGEAGESLKIIRQLLRMLYKDSSGLLQCDLGALRSLEGSWGICEAAGGPCLHWLMLDEEGRIERLFIRSASFANLPALPLAAEGEMLSDFSLIRHSIGLCHACLER